MIVYISGTLLPSLINWWIYLVWSNLFWICFMHSPLKENCEGLEKISSFLLRKVDWYPEPTNSITVFSSIIQQSLTQVGTNSVFKTLLDWKQNIQFLNHNDCLLYTLSDRSRVVQFQKNSKSVTTWLEHCEKQMSEQLDMKKAKFESFVSSTMQIYWCLSAVQMKSTSLKYIWGKYFPE